MAGGSLVHGDHGAALGLGLRLGRGLDLSLGCLCPSVCQSHSLGLRRCRGRMGLDQF